MSESKPEAMIICDRCGKEAFLDTVDVTDLFAHDYDTGWTSIHPSIVGGDFYYGKTHLCPRCSAIARRKIRGVVDKVLGF